MINWELNAQSIFRRLNSLSLNDENRTRAMMAMGNALTNRIKLGFTVSRNPWGQPWKPLNPVFRTGKPLRNTGLLMNSIHPQMQGQDVVIGTNLQHNGVSYPAVQQFGAEIKPKNKKYLSFKKKNGTYAHAKKVNIPARPFFPFNQNKQLDIPQTWRNSALSVLSRSLGLS